MVEDDVTCERENDGQKSPPKSWILIPVREDRPKEEAWLGPGQWVPLFTDFGFFRIITYEEKICFGFFRISLEEACLVLGTNEKSVDRTNRTMVDSPGPGRTKTRSRSTYLQQAVLFFDHIAHHKIITDVTHIMSTVSLQMKLSASPRRQLLLIECYYGLLWGA